MSASQKALVSGKRKEHPGLTPWRKWPPGAWEEKQEAPGWGGSPRGWGLARRCQPQPFSPCLPWWAPWAELGTLLGCTGGRVCPQLAVAHLRSKSGPPAHRMGAENWGWRDRALHQQWGWRCTDLTPALSSPLLGMQGPSTNSPPHAHSSRFIYGALFHVSQRVQNSTAQSGFSYHCPCFTDEKTEAWGH